MLNNGSSVILTFNKCGILGVRYAGEAGLSGFVIYIYIYITVLIRLFFNILNLFTAHFCPILIYFITV